MFQAHELFMGAELDYRRERAAAGRPKRRSPRRRRGKADRARSAAQRNGVATA